MMLVKRFKTLLIVLPVLALLFIPSGKAGLQGQSVESLLAMARARMAGIKSFAATIQYQTGGGAPVSGQVKYRAPGQVALRFSNGKQLATNGKKLWLHDGPAQITGQQDVAGLDGGIGSVTYDATGVVLNSSGGYTLKLKKKDGRQVMLRMDQSGFVNKLQIADENGNIDLMVKLSNVQFNLGFPSSTFNFHPPSSSKTILNPLNYKK